MHYGSMAIREWELAVKSCRADIVLRIVIECCAFGHGRFWKYYRKRWGDVSGLGEPCHKKWPQKEQWNVSICKKHQNAKNIRMKVIFCKYISSQEKVKYVGANKLQSLQKHMYNNVLFMNFLSTQVVHAKFTSLKRKLIRSSFDHVQQCGNQGNEHAKVPNPSTVYSTFLF